MKEFFASRRFLYGLLGALFGLHFPCAATLLTCWERYGSIGLSEILEVQGSSFLFWIIDTAPLWMGGLALLLGLKSERLHKEIARGRRILKMIREQNRIMAEDLASAKAVQESFLPVLPDYKPADIAYRYLPMSHVGGDFLSITKFHDNSAGIFIGDVSGHGISAALINSMTLSLLNRICRAYGYDPAGYLAALNSELINMIPDDKFISAIFTLLNFKESGVELVFARAGHPYPLLWRKKSGKVESYTSGGLILGCAESVDYENVHIKVEAGDTLFLYTDGVIELDKGDGEQLGAEGLTTLIEELAPGAATVEELLDRTFERLKGYSRSSRVQDDMVLIAIRINPPLQP